MWLSFRYAFTIVVAAFFGCSPTHNPPKDFEPIRGVGECVDLSGVYSPDAAFSSWCGSGRGSFPHSPQACALSLFLSGGMCDSCLPRRVPSCYADELIVEQIGCKGVNFHLKKNGALVLKAGLPVTVSNGVFTFQQLQPLAPQFPRSVRLSGTITTIEGDRKGTILLKVNNTFRDSVYRSESDELFYATLSKESSKRSDCHSQSALIELSEDVFEGCKLTGRTIALSEDNPTLTTRGCGAAVNEKAKLWLHALLPFSGTNTEFNVEVILQDPLGNSTQVSTHRLVRPRALQMTTAWDGKVNAEMAFNEHAVSGRYLIIIKANGTIVGQRTFILVQGRNKKPLPITEPIWALASPNVSEENR